MKYLTTSQIAEKWGLTERRIRMMCQEGKIEGAFLVGKLGTYLKILKNQSVSMQKAYRPKIS